MGAAGRVDSGVWRQHAWRNRLQSLAQLALSRTREYDADLNAARLTGDPEGLANALVKIESLQGGWLERIFLPGRRIPDPSLLRSHPRTRDRVERLMALKPGLAAADRYRVSGQASDPGRPFRSPVVRSPRWPISGLWF